VDTQTGRVVRPAKKNILAEHLANITESKERRKRLYRLIAAEIAADPKMMRCMKVLGVGIVSAFTLLAVIGEIGRFHSPEKLVAYIGLNPGQRQSGKGKDIRLGVGQRGRGDIRHLLIQGAHAIMRSARKLLVQVWHLLHGNSPLALESDTSFRIKLQKLAVALGTTLRTGIGLGQTLEDSVKTLLSRGQTNPELSASPCETPQPA
jgi:transposase